MKRIIYTLIISFLLACPVLAVELQGGVKYSVDSAREYLQEGQSDNAEITGHFQFEADNAEKVVYSYNNSGQVIGITVQYINEPRKGYIYSKGGSLIYMDKYDKSVDIYPHRGYRYDLDGKLNLTTLTVSKNEQFRFSPEGKLIAHAISGVIYDENGKRIGRAK